MMRLLLTGASLLAMITAAAADPIITPIAFFLFSGPLGAVASFGAIYTGLQIATAVAVVGLQAAMAGKSPKANPQDIKNTTKGTEGPGRHAFGRVRMAGEIGFGNTAGYTLYRLLLSCFGQIVAVEEWFYDGRTLTVEDDGAVSSPPWTYSGGSYLQVRWKPGDGTETAWPDLVNDFSIWTANHRVRGIGQVLLKATNPGTGHGKFARLYQGGIKELEMLARVGLFYDPRTELSAWSMNGVLICLHYFRRLPGMRDEYIDFEDLADKAEMADELVPTLTGAAPRCQLSGGWRGPLTTDVVLDMLESAGLEVRTTDAGKFTFGFLEDDPESEATFTTAHILETYPQAGPEGVTRPNVCRLHYFSPNRNYEVAEIDLSNAPWARVQDEIDRYGEQEMEVKLVFCPDPSQAQRIARRMFHMARADFGLTHMRFAGVTARGMKTISIEIPDVGEDGESAIIKVRKGTARVNDGEGRVEIPFQIIPTALEIPWDPLTMEVPPPPVMPELQYESDLDTPAAPAEYAQVIYPGGARELRIRFAGVTGGTIAEATRRNYSGANPNPWASMTEYLGHGGSNWYAYAGVDWEGDDADFRVRFFNSAEEGSYWSPLLSPRPVAAPNNSATGAPTIISAVATDVNDGVVLTFKAGELRAVRAVVQYDWESSGWTTHSTINPLRPDTIHTVTMDGFNNLSPFSQTLYWRVATLTSDGTVGTYATGSVVIPGTGGP